jgi:hypothetical protein
MQAGDASGGGGNTTRHLTTEGRSLEHTTGARPSRSNSIRNTRQQRMLPTHPERPALSAVPYRPDAALLPSADVGENQAPDGSARHGAKRIASGQRITIRWLPAQPAIERPPPAEGEYRGDLIDGRAPREVEVHALEAERAGRVFPCFHNGHYTGCIGYNECKVRCWAPRPQEREAVVRVERPAGSPCRGCLHAREVPGDYAMLDGRKVALMECRLGFWYGRAAFEDFLDDKIALNVTLPCPGFASSDGSLPAAAENSEEGEDDDWLADDEDEDTWLEGEEEDDWTV